MKVLLDTNVLVRLTNRDGQDYDAARTAVARCVEDDFVPVLFPQSVYELWTVMTRSKAANGFGLNASQTLTHIDALLDRFELLPDPPELATLFLDLMQRYGVTGTNAYDGRLVAAMVSHGLHHLLTFNGRDFRRYDEITVIDPD